MREVVVGPWQRWDLRSYAIIVQAGGTGPPNELLSEIRAVFAVWEEEIALCAGSCRAQCVRVVKGFEDEDDRHRQPKGRMWQDHCGYQSGSMSGSGGPADSRD